MSNEKQDATIPAIPQDVIYNNRKVTVTLPNGSVDLHENVAGFEVPQGGGALVVFRVLNNRYDIFKAYNQSGWSSADIETQEQIPSEAVN